MNNEIKHNLIYNKIKEADKILLLTHERPDVDAVSSVCAMVEFLENIGKSYTAYCFDAPPRQYNFLPHHEKIKSEKNELNFDSHDLIIAFDCGGVKRTKLEDEITNRRESQYVIEIDHHIKVEDYADSEMRNPEAVSTTVIIYDLFKANKIKINKNIANCILSGILTDSGNFIYSATSDRTVQISGEMLARGGNLTQIMENTLRNKNLLALKIWGKAMSKITLNEKYGVAYTILTLNDAKGLDEEDLEGIPNFLGNLSNVKAVMVLREQKDGTLKGSFRSAHPDINVSVLARHLGGGGHIKASGFNIEGKLEKTENGWKIM